MKYWMVVESGAVVSMGYSSRGMPVGASEMTKIEYDSISLGYLL